jgi:dTDP-4-dehydrorhamnose reductase
MRVMVFGGSGLLGSSLMPYLRTCGHDVYGSARNKKSDVRVDLTDIDQVHDVLDKIMPEIVVNLAALTNVDECERQPQLAYLTHVRAVENLARWIKDKNQSCHLVQISTDQVYDGPGPHKETGVTLSNYYGFSKYAGELVAATVPSTILRTNFFGPSRCDTRQSLSDWLVQSLKQNDSITVFDDIRFSPLSLQTLIEMIEFVMAKRIQGIFNLGSRHGMSKADFAFTLAGILGLPVQRMSRGTAAKVHLTAYRPNDMCMDSSLFEETLGLKLPTLQEEIHSMKAAYAHETR